MRTVLPPSFSDGQRSLHPAGEELIPASKSSFWVVVGEEAKVSITWRQKVADFASTVNDALDPRKGILAGFKRNESGETLVVGIDEIAQESKLSPLKLLLDRVDQSVPSNGTGSKVTFPCN
jgi:hypothetical protein